jgi:peptidoglycan/LPS O-acetylase OafA/YrhL
VSERPKNPLLYTLAALVLLEGAAFVAAAIYLVVEIFVAPAASLASAIAYAVTAAIFGVLIIVLARATLRARPWVRGAIVCLSVLQLLVAGSILVTNEAPLFGWSLCLPAVAMVVLLFTGPVFRATARTPRDE